MLFKSLAISALAGVSVGQSLTALLANQSSLSNLTTYLGLFPEFAQTLSTLQNVTLLAPNNDAFTKLLNSSAGASLLTNDTSLIQAFFSYHVLNGTFANFSEIQFIPTLLQPGQFANVTGGQAVEAVTSDGKLSFISGLVSNSSAVGSPLNFTGGVVHIIDTALTIPQNVSTTAIAANLTSVTGALINSSLAETVDTLQDVTIFAPDNEAFKAIGSALPNLTVQELTTILQYHVVPNVVGYSTLLSNTSLTTAQGGNVTITVRGQDVFVNDAKVVVPNVLVANGVVHVIDNVLNPSNTTATPAPSASSGAPAFSGASSASNVPFTSGVPVPTASAATQSAPGASGSGSGSSSSSKAAAVPMKTAAVGAAALFGGAALVMNM